MKTILITGGTGFIGSHLCEYFLKKSKKVICIDNLITGDKKNIEEFIGLKNFEFIEHDISKYIDVENVDEIYNLACPASPIDYQTIPLETLWASALGTKNMLELAIKNNALLIHASTSEIYGDPMEHPQKESYFGNVNCTGPRSCYDEGKRFAESLIASYKRKFNITPKVVRIFNTYGPKMRKNDGRVIPNFINQALEDRNITIYGDGYQTRSFCYISDMIDGIIKLGKNQQFHGPVNIGNPEECSIKFLAEIIIRLTSSKSRIKFIDLPEDDPKVRRPDIALAREFLKFSPNITLELGLQKTIKWFKVR